MNSPAKKATLPFIQPLNDVDPEGFIDYYLGHRRDIEEMLPLYGAIKFSGVRIGDIHDFQRIVDGISTRFMSYVDGNSPRTKLSANVYTSTEYDKTQRITMHNELSYSARWPAKLFFSCLIPAATGGETLLADSREILREMNGDIVSEIEQRGIVYIRNLHGGTGMGPSWQDTFETGDRQRVTEFCERHSIVYEWRQGDMLRLFQPSKGILRHRSTGEKVWFNQIDQFHPLQLDEELFESLQVLYDRPEDFPTYVRFGDGGEIDAAMVREITGTIGRVTLAPSWDTNEFLVVDNELVSHGRNPYTGERNVLVAMSE